MLKERGQRHGSNSVLVREFNERVILTALRRHGRASKADLARLAGLTSNAAGMIVRELEAAGFVRSTGKRYGGRGQPATMLELNPQGAYAIGVRIDRDLVETVLVDICGSLLGRVVHDGLPDPQDAVVRIAADVAAFRRELGRPGVERLKGIGVAMPYNLGSWLVELGLTADKYRMWDSFDVQAALAAATGLRVLVENDGSAAAVGELNHGRGREIDDFIYVFIGPALGGGVVLEGDYLRGRNGNAGDIGVMPVRPSRLPSVPRTRDDYVPLLTRASLGGLRRHLAHCGTPVAAREDLARAIAARPEAFAEWCGDAADAVVAPLLASCHLLDVSTVVLDGDLPEAALDALIGEVARAAQAAVAESRKAPELLRGSLGCDAAAIGAASLPLHLSFSPMHRVLTGQVGDSFGDMFLEVQP
ncbi:ROK family transcriptional regulator [Chelatococcus sp. SYSU_G07232]|uniref:ROK family transcriptional regulator n=1 Tax=Chelatococcus albus TaxID=3047466 RepID=A0ABT7AIF3_9HYPH|nr:ROK family transcriptional regulator [Chelatococcus sp. SYSU_G07232]MDJ1159164.1 ROK family transcriptional regulator [Chelatococcus sp. SYSU_G07232]